MNGEYELAEIERRATWISGRAWTQRQTPPEPLLSDQLGLVVWCPELRGPGGVSFAERYALFNLSQWAKAIETGMAD